MKIALAQINPTTGDLKDNTEKIINEINKAKKKRVDLIIFPETSITGYYTSDLIEHEEFVKQNKEKLKEIVRQTENIIAIVGFIDYNEEEKNEDGTLRKYNSAALIQNKRVIEIIHKTLLANYRYFDDRRYFTPEKNRKPAEIEINHKKIKLGISICEDMWDDNYYIKPIKELAEKGADIIININASPFFPNKFQHRESKIREHTKNTNLPFIYVNTVGAADNGKNIIPFDGQSLFYNKSGDLIAMGKQFQEETIYLDFDLEKKDPKIEKSKYNKEKELFNALVYNLRDYAKKTGFTKATHPLSGGIDSALGLVITSEAFGKENVIAFNLPSKFNSKATRNIAEKLSKNLGVEYKIIPIQEIDKQIRQVFETNVHEIQKPVTKENIHARIRGILMMLESNDAGTLLISNGNKTEVALGYATLYGDMCGGISVIGDLSKIEVYQIAKYVNEKYGKEIIPKEIFTIKPSAELGENQVDPFDYSVVSPIVIEITEKRISPVKLIELFKNKKLDEILFEKDNENKTVYDKHDEQSFTELVYHLYNLLKRSVYKRLQGPPIIAVSDRAFGFDLRETIINKWGGK